MVAVMYLLSGLGASSVRRFLKRLLCVLIVVIMGFFEILTDRLRLLLCEHGWTNSYSCANSLAEYWWQIKWIWTHIELFCSDDPLPENWREL